MSTSTDTDPHPNPPPRAEEGTIHPFDALATIGCIYLALVTFGFAAFRYLNLLPIGASRNQDQTFFTSVNAVTLTGFEHGKAAITGYPTMGLIFVGALAVAGALTSLIGGGYLFARVVRSRISMSSLVIVSSAIILAPTLALLWRGGFDAVSASTALGLSAQRGANTLATILVVGLTVFGLLGVLPLRELFSRRTDDQRHHTGYVGLTLAGVALVSIVGIGILFACGVPVSAAGTRSLALRGFGGEMRLDTSSALPWASAFLAILGAAPASTAGGLSVLPLIVLCRGTIDAMRARAIDPLVGVAAAWLLIFILAAAATVIGLAALAPSLPADRLVLLSFAALGNVGISHEPIAITGSGLFLLSAAMLVGRVLPLVMLAWMAVVVERSRDEIESIKR